MHGVLYQNWRGNFHRLYLSVFSRSIVRVIFSNLSSLWWNDSDAGGLTDVCCEMDKDCTMLCTTGALRILCDREWGLMFLEFFCSPELFSMIAGRPVLSDIICPESTNIINSSSVLFCWCYSTLGLIGLWTSHFLEVKQPRCENEYALHLALRF